MERAQAAFHKKEVQAREELPPRPNTRPPGRLSAPRPNACARCGSPRKRPIAKPQRMHRRLRQSHRRRPRQRKSRSKCAGREATVRLNLSDVATNSIPYYLTSISLHSGRDLARLCVHGRVLPSRGRADVRRHSKFRPRRTETSDDSDSDFIDGTYIFAVKQENVEAGRKGQRGPISAAYEYRCPQKLRCVCLHC